MGIAGIAEGTRLRARFNHGYADVKFIRDNLDLGRVEALYLHAYVNSASRGTKERG